MKLYFTRHGKTRWNQEGRLQGKLGDSPLLESSYTEIRHLGRSLSEIEFEAIYASPQLRARRTALEIQNQFHMHVPIYYEDGLCEMGFGQLEGTKIAHSKLMHGDALHYRKHRLDLYDPSAFGGETIDALLARTTRVIEQAVQAHEGPLLFVGHGASLTATIQFLLGKEYAQLREMGGLDNNSLTILTTKDKQRPYKLDCWNSFEFLDKK